MEYISRIGLICERSDFINTLKRYLTISCLRLANFDDIYTEHWKLISRCAAEIYSVLLCIIRCEIALA